YRAQRPHNAGELPALGLADVGEDRGMVDDQGRVLRRFACQCGQISAQVAATHERGVPPCHSDRVRQPPGTVGIPRPQQALQPAHVICITDVQRVEVEPGSPPHVWDTSGERYWAPWLAPG